MIEEKITEIDDLSIDFYRVEKDGITYTLKSDLELLNENLITKEEYNERIDIKRQKSYNSITDNLLLDFMSSYLESRKDTLTSAELEIWKVIESKKHEIKEQYPKQN